MKIKKSSIIFLATTALILAPISNYSQKLSANNSIERKNTMEDEKNLERAKIYEEAADKRRKAADAQAKNAEELLNEAEEKKLNYIIEIAPRKKMFYIAGMLELKAAELESYASKNYEFSANNLGLAIKIYEILPEEENEKLPKIIKQQKDDAINALNCYNKTIESYLSAANTFSKNHADDLEKEADANIKAAIELEKKADKK